MMNSHLVFPLQVLHTHEGLAKVIRLCEWLPLFDPLHLILHISTKLLQL